MSTYGKFIFFIVILLILNMCMDMVKAANECGRTPVDAEVLKMAPCSRAAHNLSSRVSNACCFQVKQLGQNPPCLCAVMLSPTARIAGVRPEVAITIPKRCNLADRPIGYKCGAYTLP